MTTTVVTIPAGKNEIHVYDRSTCIESDLRYPAVYSAPS